MTDYEVIRSMVLNFRLTELQTLLTFAGQSRAGRKSELQTRALELIRGNPRDLANKVKELSEAMYKSIGGAASVNPYSPNFVSDASVPMRETRSRASLSQTSNVTSKPSSSASTTTSSPSVSSGSTSQSDASSGYSSASSSSSGQYRSHTSGISSSTSSDFIPLSLASPYQPNYTFGPFGTNSGSSSVRHSNEKSGYFTEKTSHVVYPLCTDVKLRRLPFYDVEAVLLKPSSLQPKGSARFQEQTFSFNLTPAQATGVNGSIYRDEFGRPEYKKQIQLRFSLMETSCEQDDNFPLSICVKVNGKLQQLPNPIPTNKPGVEPRRPPKPLNITSLCRISPLHTNFVNVSWTVEPGRGFTVSVYFVDKLTSNDLLKRLKHKGLRNSDYTRALIKDKLNDNDSEIATTTCKVSLACPLGKMRMSLPCRASTCDHLQCFDANLYLKMNEKKAKWLCPVCNKPALYDNLLLDGFFNDVLLSSRLPRDDHDIVLHQDGSWDPYVPKKEASSSAALASVRAAPAAKSESKVETLSVDDDDVIESVQQAPAATATSSGSHKRSANASVDCITIDSDSEEEILPPTSKRPRISAFLDEEDSSSTSSILSSATLTPSSESPPLRPLSESMPPPPPSTKTLQPPSSSAPLTGSSSPVLICIDDDDD